MPKAKEKSFRLQNYRKEWEKEPWAVGWLTAGKTPGKAYCLRCEKNLSVGKSELIKHANSQTHVSLVKGVQSNVLMTTFIQTPGCQRIRAELNTVALLVRKNISLNFLDDYMETLHFIAEDSKSLKDMTCNRTKGTYLLTECLGLKAHDDLVKDLKSSNGFSILCDKATDITMTKIFCVNVRFVDPKSSEIKSELYRLIPVEEGNATGLFNALSKCLEEDGIPWSKIVGYASDGENLMQGENNSFLTKMKEVVPNLFVLKCFCHSFHLVASHACGCLSKTAEQLVHDIYNYFKLSPNRQKSFEEFQHFVDLEPHRILRPCQTRWLSLSQCVNRIIEQWPALELFFVGEVAETKCSTQATSILSNMKAPYVKATLEFLSFVLSDIVALNMLFQSDEFKLHRLLPEVHRIIRMFCQNFMKEVPPKESMASVEQDVDDEWKWKAVIEVYPGICAYETMDQLKPHEKESFLARCRDWYREAVKQILKRVDVSSPVLNAIQDVNHASIINQTARSASAGILFRNLPVLKQPEATNITTIDAQWRSLLIDEDVKKGGWETKSISDFWRGMKQVHSYTWLATFMLEVIALPQSTAVVERTFSKINLNKTKLRNRLSVQTTEAIVKVSHRFPANFKVDGSLTDYYKNARSRYMYKYSDTERSVSERECVDIDM